MMPSSSASATFDLSSLKNQLFAHNEYFDSLINMIPSLVYNNAPTNTSGEIEFNSKYHKGMSKESKEAKRARQKAAKISKFENPETTVEAKSRIRKREEEALQKTAVDGGECNIKNRDEISRLAFSKVQLDCSSGVSRIEQLRAKLRSKIAEKQQHQHPPMSTAGDIIAVDAAGAISKRAARRAEKLKRIEAAKARKSAGTGGRSNVIHKSGGQSDMNEQLTHLVADTETQVKVEDDLEGINFGAMAGFDATPHYMNNKSLANLGKKKSLDRLLQEVEAKRQRLKELKESGDVLEREKASRMEWGDVLREAASIPKQPNDPQLIKKALKRKTKQKASSSKAWEARTKQTEQSMAERQKVRSHNLEKRKIGGSIAANLSKKKIVEEAVDDDKGRTKRRRMGPHSQKNRAGFEGKKQEYINNGDSNKAKGSGQLKSKCQ
jgi:hypothetical protein